MLRGRLAAHITGEWRPFRGVLNSVNISRVCLFLEVGGGGGEEGGRRANNSFGGVKVNTVVWV